MVHGRYSISELSQASEIAKARVGDLGISPENSAAIRASSIQGTDNLWQAELSIINLTCLSISRAYRIRNELNLYR